MKFSDVTFPHPVLGVGDGISGEVGLGSNSPEISSNSDSYTIAVNCSHSNKDLNKLIENDKATYFCEATCTNTLFRKVYTSDNEIIELQIPKKQVRGKVEFTCLLIAKTDLSDYQNIDSHEDYATYNFDLDKGDVLAYFGEFSFNADIRYEKLKAVSTFMEVLENADKNAEHTNIVLDSNKIQVQLPTEEYAIFSQDIISKEEKFAPIFHASIVLNALLLALYHLKDHKERPWAIALKYRLDNEEELKNISIDDEKNIPEIAQRLLGNPFNRLMQGMKNIVESDNNEE